MFAVARVEGRGLSVHRVQDLGRGPEPAMSSLRVPLSKKLCKQMNDCGVYIYVYIYTHLFTYLNLYLYTPAETFSDVS